MPSERDNARVAITVLILVIVAVLAAWGTIKRYSPVVKQVKQADAESDERNRLIEELAAP